MVTRQIRVNGRVQGVGYRAALQRAAREHGVSGWVRNRADGSVEALLQGSAQAIEALIDWARNGPPGARVTSVADMGAETTVEREPAHASFEIRSTL